MATPLYSLGAKLFFLCAGPGEVSNLGCERLHCSLYHLLVSFEVLRETNLGIFARGNLLLSTSNLPLGVTNEESCHTMHHPPIPKVDSTWSSKNEDSDQDQASVVPVSRLVPSWRACFYRRLLKPFVKLVCTQTYFASMLDIMLDHMLVISVCTL